MVYSGLKALVLLGLNRDTSLFQIFRCVSAPRQIARLKPRPTLNYQKDVGFLSGALLLRSTQPTICTQYPAPVAPEAKPLRGKDKTLLIDSVLRIVKNHIAVGQKTIKKISSFYRLILST